MLDPLLLPLTRAAALAPWNVFVGTVRITHQLCVCPLLPQVALGLLKGSWGPGPQAAAAAIARGPGLCLRGWLFAFLMVFYIAFLVLLLDVLQSTSLWMDAMNQ